MDPSQYTHPNHGTEKSSSMPHTNSIEEAPLPWRQSSKCKINHCYANSLMQDEIVATATCKSPNDRKTHHSNPPQDIIGSILGDFGVWQLRTVLIIFLNKIPAAWFMACIIFTAPELEPRTEFACALGDLQENYSVSTDQCYVYEDAKGERCSQFVYNFSFDSLITQFDLVCFRDIFVAWTQYWHLFGVLVGGVVGTKMMVCISPRNTYFIGQVTQIVCGILTGYARDFSLHCAFRCLSAVCCAIMFTSGQAIFTDITAGTYRLGAIILYDTFWSIGVILLPTLSSFFNSWTHIYLGITFPTLLLILLLQWTPDSPRWLLKNSGSPADVDAVAESIRKAAQINDRLEKIPADFRQQLESLREKMQSAAAPAKWTELWRGTRRAKTHMIAAHLALSAFIINFMGMLLNIRSFGRDYLVANTIAMGFSEIVGCFLALHLTLEHSKWKWQCAGVVNIVSGLIGCLGWIFSGNDSMDPAVKVILWMIIATIPKAAVSCAQSMLFACMSELMPSDKKAPFVFSVVTFARIWLLSAPFLNVLKKFDTALSLSSYSVLSIVGGIFTCLLVTPRDDSPQTPNILKIESLVKKEDSASRGTLWTTANEDGLNTKL